MPAYGQQVIPDVPQVPAPKVPVAPDTVPNLIGSMGNAGLAAFVSMNNQRNRLALEEKALQQKAVLDQQHMGLEREKMAQDFQISSRRMDLDKELTNIRSGSEAAYLDDLRGFMGQVREFKGDRKSAEFAALVEQAVYDNPLVLRHPKGIEAFTAYTKPHDEANDVRALLKDRKAALQAEGFVPSGATITPKGDVSVRAGITIPEAPTRESRLEIEKQKAQAARELAELKAAEKAVNNFEILSAKEREDNIEKKKADIPYSRAKEQQAAIDRLNALRGGSPETAAAPTRGTADQTYAGPKTVDPRLVLAQKALDDPNATDAEKAQARKLLGIQ